MVRLTSPLRDASNLPAIPTGSEVVVRVDGVMPNGYVRMSGVAFVTHLGGRRQEIPLAAGIVTIRGESGDALLAEGDRRWGGQQKLKIITTYLQLTKTYTIKVR